MAYSTTNRPAAKWVLNHVKDLLCTNFKLMFSVMLLSISSSSLLQLATNNPFINPSILESITSKVGYLSFNFGVSISVPFILSIIVVVPTMYIFNMIHIVENVKVSFITKLCIIVIDTAYKLILIAVLCNYKIILSILSRFPLLLRSYLHANLLLGLIVSVSAKSPGVPTLRGAMKVVQGTRQLVFSLSFMFIEIIMEGLYAVKDWMLAVVAKRMDSKVAVLAIMLGMLLTVVHMVMSYECKKRLANEEETVNKESKKHGQLIH